MKTFTGRVKSGAGKATRNIARAAHRLRKATGITFQPGTLNLILDRPVRFRNQVECRTWGLCPVRVNGLKCFAIRSLRKDYARAFMEVIAPFKLREKLDLVDGSTVSVEVDPTYIMEDR